MGVYWKLIIVVVLVASLAICLVIFRDQSTAEMQTLVGQMSPAKRATANCEGFVKVRLKAPSTAKFSNEATSVNGRLYTVTGDVDAQNSFGAMLRNRYSCFVTKDGTLRDLDIE
jgi:cytochrome c biogenesis protein ResB